MISPSPIATGDTIIPSYDWLEVATPEGIAPVPVRAGGWLDRLRILAEGLSRRYGWKAAEAATFVLTDDIPLVRSMEIEWTMRFGGNTPTPRARVTLTVDPATTPDEIRERYRAERDELFGGRRHRSLSTKHLRLAAHDLQQPEDASPSARMAAWNDLTRHLAGYRYGHVSNYSRDAKLARRRLTELPVDWRAYFTRGFEKNPIESENGTEKGY